MSLKATYTCMEFHNTRLKSREAKPPIPLIQINCELNESSEATLLSQMQQ